MHAYFLWPDKFLYSLGSASLLELFCPSLALFTFDYLLFKDSQIERVKFCDFCDCAVENMAAGQRLLRCIASQNGLLASRAMLPAFNTATIRNFAAAAGEDITIEVCHAPGSFAAGRNLGRDPSPTQPVQCVGPPLLSTQNRAPFHFCHNQQRGADEVLRDHVQVQEDGDCRRHDVQSQVHPGFLPPVSPMLM